MIYSLSFPTAGGLHPSDSPETILFRSLASSLLIKSMAISQPSSCMKSQQPWTLLIPPFLLKYFLSQLLRYCLLFFPPLRRIKVSSVCPLNVTLPQGSMLGSLLPLHIVADGSPCPRFSLTPGFVQIPVSNPDLSPPDLQIQLCLGHRHVEIPMGT